MDDQVRIPADGRGEMGVRFGRQAKMAHIVEEYLAHFIDRRRILFTTRLRAFPRLEKHPLKLPSKGPLHPSHLMSQLRDESSVFIESGFPWGLMDTIDGRDSIFLPGNERRLR